MVTAGVDPLATELIDVAIRAVVSMVAQLAAHARAGVTEQPLDEVLWECVITARLASR